MRCAAFSLLLLGLMISCSSPSSDCAPPLDTSVGQDDTPMFGGNQDRRAGPEDLTPTPDQVDSELGEPGQDTSREEEQAGYQYECEPMTIESCVTTCGSAGTRKCLKEWQPCIPPEEFCGNCTDDDCDGAINEGCPLNQECQPPIEPECPVAIITMLESAQGWTGDTIHLSAAQSYSLDGEITKWLWSVQAPAGSAVTFSPSAEVMEPTVVLDVAGQYLLGLEVWDSTGAKSCFAAQTVLYASTYPPVTPEIGCADGTREGFLSKEDYPHIAGCSGAWSNPGITPDEIVPTCNRQGGNSGQNGEGTGCAAPDLCAEGWHICVTWHEVAIKSPTGCAGAVPPDAKPKSLFFALRQPSENGSVCGEWGDGFNDVFGCGNLGAGLGPDKACGPLDRVLASTQPDTCGFNEAEPNLGPWQCMGGPSSHLNEGLHVTKTGCPNTSCQYDGYPVGNSDKGGVLCCRDD